MLNFFRRIRRKILQEGILPLRQANFKRYAVYAFGEIVLIVIGILIALQLNEWKENSQRRTTEVKLLSELRIDLEEAEREFISSLEFDRKVIISKQVIIDVIEKDIPWHDSLQIHFNLFNFWNTYTIKSTAYNSIENWGINNISNDSIRRQIINIFQSEIHHLSEMEQNERQVQLTSYNDIISIQLDWSNIEQVRPVNYDTFLMNEDLALRLKAFKTFSQLHKGNRELILQRIVQTKENIIAEINRLSKT